MSYCPGVSFFLFSVISLVGKTATPPCGLFFFSFFLKTLHENYSTLLVPCKPLLNQVTLTCVVFHLRAYISYKMFYKQWLSTVFYYHICISRIYHSAFTTLAELNAGRKYMQRRKNPWNSYLAPLWGKAPPKQLPQAKSEVPSAFQTGILSLLNLLLRAR